MAQRNPPSARRVPLWLVLLVLIVLAVPVVWALMPREAPLQEALFDPQADRAVVLQYQNRSWEPASEPITLLDENMRAVGQSQGFTVYSSAQQGGGAGEAGPEAATYYLKVGEDRYVPLQPRGTEPNR